MRDLTAPWGRLRLFWLLNYPFFCLLFLSYARHHVLAYDPVSISYFVLLSLVQAGIFSGLLLVALPALLYLLSWRKLSPLFFAGGFAVIGLFILIIDSLTYLQFRAHINGTMLAMILSPARAQVFDLTWVEYASMAITVSLIIALEAILYWLLRYLKVWVQKTASIIQGVIILLALVVQGAYAWADAAYEPRILQASELSPGFYGATAKRFLARHHLIDVGNRPMSMAAQTTKKINYPHHPLQLDVLTNKPNILIIAIDAWRYDSLNSEITPEIASFAQQACRYDHHYSGGNSTRAGLFSFFYSVNPGDFDAFYRAGRGPVLFDVLYQQGYQVGVYPSASAVSPPFHRTTFVNVRNFEPTTAGNDSIERDRAIATKVKTFMRSAHTANQPFFAFAFFDSVHGYNDPQAGFNPPLQPTAKVSHLTLQDKKQQLLYQNQYRNAAYFVDSLVGDILKELSRQGLLANTLVMITADHGEEFDDNKLGFWGHNGNFTAAQTHVPLVVHWPDQQKPLQYQHTTSHYDIVPTLLSMLLGVKNPLADYSLGLTLNNTQARNIILMGSYGKIAIFAPTAALIAVTNRLGIFHNESLQGLPLTKLGLPGDLFKMAFAQINHFHGR